MAVNIDKAHVIRNGLGFNDIFYLFEIDSDPSVSPGFEAPIGSIAIRYSSGDIGTWQKKDVANTEWEKIIYRSDIIVEKTVDPSINDDITAGYLIGTIWVNTISTSLFFCVDNASGAAVWSSSSGITESSHRQLEQLVHDIYEDSYTEFTYSGNNISNEIIWKTSSKLLKIREYEYIYTSGKISQIVTKQYNSSGAVIETYTETLTYSGNKIENISGVYS